MCPINWGRREKLKSRLRTARKLAVITVSRSAGNGRYDTRSAPGQGILSEIQPILRMLACCWIKTTKEWCLNEKDAHGGRFLPTSIERGSETVALPDLERGGIEIRRRACDGSKHIFEQFSAPREGCPSGARTRSCPAAVINWCKAPKAGQRTPISASAAERSAGRASSFWRDLGRSVGASLALR